jgi:hypothetical protein
MDYLSVEIFVDTYPPISKYYGYFIIKLFLCNSLFFRVFFARIEDLFLVANFNGVTTLTEGHQKNVNKTKQNIVLAVLSTTYM